MTAWRATAARPLFQWCKSVFESQLSVQQLCFRASCWSGGWAAEATDPLGLFGPCPFTRRNFDVNFGKDRSFGFGCSFVVWCDSDVNFGDEGPRRRRRAVPSDEFCPLRKSRFCESLEVV